MLERHVDTMYLAIQGILFLLLGSIMMILCRVLMWRIVLIFGVIFLLTAFLTLMDWLWHIKRFDKLLYGLGELMLAVFVLCYPSIPVALLPILFGCMMFLHMSVHAITAYLYFRNQIADCVKEMLLTLIYAFLGILMLLEPLMYVEDLIFVIGAYLCCYGIAKIKDALWEEMKVSTKNKMRRKVRVQLPVLLASLIPYRVLTYINAFFKENEEENAPMIAEYKEDTEPDLEVLIHVTDKGFGAFGHVDICYHGYIISYGNYDASSYRLHDTIGDGVLFVAKKEQYIPFCIADSQKTLFGFGMILTKENKLQVNRRIREIFRLLEPWQPEYQKAKLNGDDKAMEGSLKYYANRLYQKTGAKMYKFKSGPFKTYFVLKTNCVALADSIIGKTGIDLIQNNGIITPGSYYDYFNTEFMKSVSKVITRTIYH